MIVEYSSNNSGGDWWLSDDDWKKLEAAGWNVVWVKDLKSSIFSASPDGRWLGTLARGASGEFISVDAAKENFAQVTGQDPEACGCECCGQPHYFSERL